jgi:hypothetical protein
MKICCCYTPAHEVLFRGYFLPSLPAGLVHESHRLEIPGGGDFLSPEFLQCIRRKITLIRESLIANSGSVILWSDVDIVFQKDMSGVILAAVVTRITPRAAMPSGKKSPSSQNLHGCANTADRHDSGPV